MLKRFEDGITPRRIALIAGAMLAVELTGFAVVFAIYLFTADTPPMGHDFAAFWSAAQLAAQGRAEAAFDGAVMHGLQTSVAPVPGTLYWHYPPTFGLLILPLGWVGYRVGFVLFSLLGMAAFAWATARVAPEEPLRDKLPVLAAPIVWSSFVQGQNGAFVALFLVMFLLALERADWRKAGLWGALLLIKPHFGVLLPIVVLLRPGGWRVFGWGLLWGALFCAAATLVLGAGYWQAFLDNSNLLWRAMLTGQLAEQQISAFAFVQNIGLPYGYGAILQAATALAAAALTVAVWRAPDAGPALRMASLLICSLMVSPYAFYYDAPVSAIALFLLFRDGQQRGFAPGERITYLLFWMAPVLHLILADRYHIFILYPVFLLLMWQAWRRLRIARAPEQSAAARRALP